jgi:hypothetical protein
VLELSRSSYGHIEAMACSEAEGAQLAGARAVDKHVPEAVPFATARRPGFNATAVKDTSSRAVL